MGILDLMFANIELIGTLGQEPKFTAECRDHVAEKWRRSRSKEKDVAGRVSYQEEWAEYGS